MRRTARTNYTDIGESKLMPRDPVCGMEVDKETGIKRKIGDRTYYFCSQSCADVYEQPERELKAMKRRVVITLVGVIAAAGLRVLVTLGLLAAITTLEIVGGIKALSLTIFIVSVPVVWVAGFSIIKGAYFSLRNRNINMDVLGHCWSSRWLDVRGCQRVFTPQSQSEAKRTWKYPSAS